jgi:hypothetical protein
MQTSQFKIYAPLQNFFWRETDFKLAPGFWIKHFNQNQKPNLSGLDKHLSEDEKTSINTDASHWLTFHWNEGSEPCPAKTVDLVLIALWLAKPTASHVAFRFKLGQGESADKKGVSRLYDRFAWLPDDAHEKFADSDLQTAKSFYPPLRDICCARGGRLNNALMLTLTGCFSIYWQVALICHAAAAEALLTYSTKPGSITRRLATSYACLGETQKTCRDAAYNEFCTLYSIRSDIMHGRTHEVDPAERLPLLARFQTVLRRLWCTVLSSPQLISVLEGSDAQREVYFSQLASGYTPPP